MTYFLRLPHFRNAVSSPCFSVMNAPHPYRRGMLLNMYVPYEATTCGHFDEMTVRCYMDPLMCGKSNVFS